MIGKKAMSVKQSPTLEIDSKVKEMRGQGIQVISFGVGEPDFDTPENIREAGIAAIREGYTRYTPASGTLELKEAICRKLERDNGLIYNPGQIVVSNGAKHSLSNVFAVLLNPRDEVMIPIPYWVSYPEMVKLNDGVPVFVQTKEENFYKVTVSDLEKARSSKTKALVLNSPSNPTGQMYSKNDLASIGKFCETYGIYIISDEIYEKLVYGGNESTSIAAQGEGIKELSIIINGVSKSYAMTGWRIGYTASVTEIAKAMSSIQSHATSNPSSISQKAALAALNGPQDRVHEMLGIFDARRKYMFNKVKEIPGLKALEPQGAFYVFVSIAQLIGKSYRYKVLGNSDDFGNMLLENKRVAVVPGSGFGAPDFIRLSYATSMEQIVEGLSRIEAFITELE